MAGDGKTRQTGNDEVQAKEAFQGGAVSAPKGAGAVFVLAAAVLGAACGCIIWFFFVFMDIGITFFWETLPSSLSFTWYPVAVCAFGGLIIGLFRKRFGDYPEELQEVLAKVKVENRYEYGNAPAIAVAALLPLVFGGSIGPEAGLSGVIAGLCTWVGDRFKFIAKGIDGLAQVGVSAALSVIFAMPLFGLIAPEETGDDSLAVPHRAKMLVYLTAIFGGVGAYALLNSIFGGGMSLGRFEATVIGQREIILFIPLVLAGIIAGYLYYLSDKISGIIIKPFERFPVLLPVLGGVLLGVCGVLLPFTMFAGETQMTDIMEGWTSMTAVFLLATGLLKIIVINICIRTGWKGGNIFPLIFSGVCIGYGLARLLGVDGVFAVAAVTAALCGAVMRKPVSVVLVLLLCFPLKGVISMSAAAFIGAYAPIPELLKRSSEA